MMCVGNFVSYGVQEVPNPPTLIGNNDFAGPGPGVAVATFGGIAPPKLPPCRQMPLGELF